MIINIYSYIDYREIIKKLAKEQCISFKSLANSARIHTSYFSRVMAKGANFSTTQLYLIGRDLGLGEQKLEYFLLLGEYFAASNNAHKEYLEKKIEKIKNEKQKTIADMEDVETSLSSDFVRVYYQEPITATIHMYLTLKKYRKNPKLIMAKTSIPEFKLKMELDKLESLGIIKKLKNQIELNKFNVHLDEASPLISSTHINWRLEAIAYLQKRSPRPSDHHISAVFTTDDEGKIKIKELFKKFILDAQKQAAKYKENEEVLHINFDLY